MTPLPSNLEAEQALLGALLFDNQIIERLGPLKGEHFYDPVHGRLFDAAKQLISAGTVADGVRLKDWANTDPGMKELGGVRYLMRVMDAAAPLAAQAATYSELIQDLANRRAIYRICQETAREAAALEEATGDIVHKAGRELSALMLGNTNWITLRDAGDRVYSELLQPVRGGLRTGLAKLDGLLAGGLYPPDLVIVAGRPAMGKTALADVIAANVADGGGVVGFFSMEMAPDQIAARVLARRSAATGQRFSYSDFRGRERPDPRAVAPLLENLSRNLLIDPMGAQTLAGIEASARAMRSKVGALDLIIVDYLQLMRDPTARRDGRTQEVSEITAGLKALAKKLDVAVVALSQLSRAVEGRADKTPQLSDLRESGSIEQDADVVLFVFREHYYLERNAPTPQADESKADFSARLNQHTTRLKDTAHDLKLICSKNRHGPCGVESLWVDLSMDVVLDEPERLKERAL